MMTMVMPGDGVRGHEIRVYQKAWAESNSGGRGGFVVGSVGTFKRFDFRGLGEVGGFVRFFLLGSDSGGSAWGLRVSFRDQRYHGVKARVGVGGRRAVRGKGL